MTQNECEDGVGHIILVRRLYDVTVTSYEVQWYTFWYQWIEEVHTYTLAANIGISGIPNRKFREDVLPQVDEG